MAWWDGKTAISICALGDSNMNALGYQLGVQQDIASVNHYCSATGQVPYSEANMGWRHISPDSESRVPTEFASYTALFPNTGYVGQLFGSNGAPAIEIANTLAVGTGIDTYLYQVASPGMTSVQFSSGACWDTIARTAQAALDSIPGSPDYFDVFVTNFGINDMFTPITDENYYLNMKLMRQNMIDAGWWIPGTTQVIILEMPRIASTAPQYPDVWLGHDFFLNRLNDKNGRASSVGLEIIEGDPIPVHFTAADNTRLGKRAGDLLVSGLSDNRSVLSIGGTRISLGGLRIKAHSALALMLAVMI